MQGVVGRALSLSGLRRLFSATASVGGSGGGCSVGGGGALHRTCRAPTLQCLTQRFSSTGGATRLADGAEPEEEEGTVAAPDPPAVIRGQAALRDYLARPDHARVTRMAPAEFARWVELEVLTYMCNNVSASLRVRADVIRRLHAATLEPLAQAAEEAEAAYSASAEGGDISRKTALLFKTRAEIVGILAYMEQDPTGMEMQMKQAAYVAKVEAAKAAIPAAEAELEAAMAASALWCRREEARGALSAARDAAAGPPLRRVSSQPDCSWCTGVPVYPYTLTASSSLASL